MSSTAIRSALRPVAALSCALALLLPIGCTSESSSRTSVPAPAASAPGTASVEGVTSSRPAPAMSSEEGAIVPAAVPKELQAEVDAATAALAEAKEAVELLSQSGQVGGAQMKEVEERLARAEAHLKEILDRAAKAAAGGE